MDTSEWQVATVRRRALNVVAAMVVATPTVLTVGVGTAGAEGATFLSFAQTLRRCDFSARMYTGPAAYGRPTAVLHNSGAELIADVQLATALPNTPYEVRVIQMPRSSASSCNAGDPGVIGGVLVTDDAGAGSVTVRGPVARGATGAWVYVGRPGEYSQTPAEFYTSDFVVKL